MRGTTCSAICNSWYIGNKNTTIFPYITLLKLYGWVLFLILLNDSSYHGKVTLTSEMCVWTFNLFTFDITFYLILFYTWSFKSKQNTIFEYGSTHTPTNLMLLVVQCRIVTVPETTSHLFTETKALCEADSGSFWLVCSFCFQDANCCFLDTFDLFKKMTANLTLSLTRQWFLCSLKISYFLSVSLKQDQ